MRKKPPGTLLSSNAHAVEREYRILAALSKYNNNPSTLESRRIPVPRPLSLCEDPAVLGTPFYIMEFLEGRIFEDSKLLDLPREERRLWFASGSTPAECSLG